MWCVVMTETGIMGEAKNPAHVVVESYHDRMASHKAFVHMYADKVAQLGLSLEYSEINVEESEARVFGSVEVIVIAKREMPEPADGPKEVRK